MTRESKMLLVLLPSFLFVSAQEFATRLRRRPPPPAGLRAPEP